MVNSLSYTILFSSKAEKEIRYTWAWYEERQIGLGDRFVDELLLRIKAVQQQPELFSSKYKSYREVKLAVFPMLIIYRINKRKKVIRIVAVFHTSRDYKSKYS